MSGIFVVAEHRKGVLRDISFEMLHKAAELAVSSGEKIYAAVLGNNTGAFAQALSKGADEVLAVSHESLENFNGELYQTVLRGIIEEYSPSLIIAGQTATGMEFAPALAASLKLPFVSDCSDISFSDGRIEITRQPYNGKVHTVVAVKKEGPVFVTLRSGVFPQELKTEKAGAIKDIPFDGTGDCGKKFLEYIEAATGSVDITQADVLVSVGQGIGDAKNIPMMEAFAEALGASLSCSRPVVDRKWLPQERQVGTSGKTVKPKVYLAVGISGAFQHVTAVKADTVIAINKDPKAPVFNVADYGIVGDLFQIIPRLQDEVLKLKGGK